jgi:hypothetical protein
MNWRGRPLESHEVIVELIGATTTHTGLRVRAELDRGRYPLGVKVRERSWRRCRCGGTTSTGSGTTPFIRSSGSTTDGRVTKRGPLTTADRSSTSVPVLRTETEQQQRTAPIADGQAFARSHEVPVRKGASDAA